MSEKIFVKVNIGGNEYTLSSYEGEEYLHKVESYINNKLREFSGMDEFRRLPVQTRSTLVEINMAGDYLRAQTKLEQVEKDLAHKDTEILDLKHEAIQNQIRAEEAEKAVQEAEEANRKLEDELKQVINDKEKLEIELKQLTVTKERLEKTLEDQLLGKLGK